MQDYEESVSFLGSWGPFQRKIIVLLCLICIPSGYNMLSFIFLMASPQHHCHIPAHSNLSQEWIQASIPVQVGSQQERSSCSRYELDLVKNLSAIGARPTTNWTQNQSGPGSSPEVLVSTLNQEECKDGWTYSTEYYQSTVVTEFDLVCSEQWKQPLTSLIMLLGGFFGCFISGPISDRFGRKPVLLGCIFILSTFSTAAAFASSWPVFTFCFFMLGIGQLTCYVAVFVLGSEILVGSTRILFSCLWINVSYVSGMMLLTVTAYLLRSWRYLSLLMAVPGLACIPLWWLIPESPRWLVSSGHLQEADLLVRSAALENRVNAPPVIFSTAKSEKTESEQAQSHTFLDLLKTPNIRYVTIKLWFVWFASSLGYYVMTFGLSNLHGNPYLNYLLLSAIELPANFASWLVARSFPRRLSYISFVLLGATAMLCFQITTHSHSALQLSLVLLGKFGVLVGIGVMFVYTGEVFPTVIRNTAMSSCAMFFRVGSSISPYLMELVVFYQFLPWMLVGALLLLSVLICIFLPETFRQPLPDTIQQMPFTQWWSWSSKSSLNDDEKSAKEPIRMPEVICTTHL